MCGRFSLSASAELLEAAFDLAGFPGPAPRYNVAPGQPVAVIRRLAPDDDRRWDVMSWGLLPSWAKEARAARPINARAETVAEKPTFREAFRTRRCLIPADAFFEWRRTGAHKVPCCFRRRDHAPFAFAGLWDRWTGSGGEEVASCVILTTRPNALVAPVHDRMPVILPPAAYERWLDPALRAPGDLLPLLQPFPEEALVSYAVDPRVGSPLFDDPACLVPVAPPEQLPLF